MAEKALTAVSCVPQALDHLEIASLNPQFSSLLNGAISDSNLRGSIRWVDWKIIYYLLKEHAKRL